MRHHVTYESQASGMTRASVIGVTNGSAAVSLTIAREGAAPGQDEDRISAPLDVDAALMVAADLIMHAINLSRGVHGNGTGALDASSGSGAQSAVIVSDVRQLAANVAAHLDEIHA